MALMEADEDRVVDVWSNSLHIRLAQTIEEVEAAQALRYQVFYEEMAAKATAEMVAAGRDFDSFDEHCDHLLVFDSERGEGRYGQRDRHGEDHARAEADERADDSAGR